MINPKQLITIIQNEFWLIINKSLFTRLLFKFFDLYLIAGNKNIKKCKNIAKIMMEAGFNIDSIECDIPSRESILNFIKKGQ